MIDRLTYRSEFVLIAVLKVFEELTSCLILFECQLKHFSLVRVLLYATTQWAPDCCQNNQHRELETNVKECCSNCSTNKLLFSHLQFELSSNFRPFGRRLCRSLLDYELARRPIIGFSNYCFSSSLLRCDCGGVWIALGIFEFSLPSISGAILIFGVKFSTMPGYRGLNLNSSCSGTSSVFAADYACELSSWEI